MARKSFHKKIKRIIGEEIYNRLDKEANNEVSLALKMPLKDKYGKDKYYRQRFITPLTIEEHAFFEEKKLNVSPADIINLLFRCKLLFAVETEAEYSQRAGGGSYVDEGNFIVPWTKRAEDLETIIEEYFERVKSFKMDRILIAEINSFRSSSDNPQEILDKLFKKLKLPFVCYIDEGVLIEKHKEFEPHLKEYTLERAKRFFNSPSIGVETSGTYIYAYRHGSAWLRTFLSMLKVGGFLNPSQIDFGPTDINIVAPTSPVFLSTSSFGAYGWDEDAKESWEKLPDGCLFLSFGYRGISKMWIDNRNYNGIEEFFIENKKIFKFLRNPWNETFLKDIAPTLDILSSATQMPDLGVKILLLYCCLEHLFVPRGLVTDNKKYIVGGINALRPDLLEWFNRLYTLRCDYAHKGFVKKDDKTLGLIMESMRNVMKLLTHKLG